VHLEIEFESVAFVDSGQSGTLDRADVHERVFLAIVARYEAKALHRVEELDRSGGLLTGQLALRPGGLLLHRNYIAHDLQIGSRDLPAAIDKIEGQLLPFSQALEASALHLADVDEHVLSALIALDEAEALLAIEELHFALAGADDLRGHAAATAATGRPAITAEAATAPAAVTAKAVSATDAVTTARRTPVVTTAEARPTARKRIEATFAETVPRVAAPAAVTANAVSATEAVTAARRTPVVTTAEARPAARKRIEAIFAETVPLVASPAATSSIVTHEPVVPLLASFPPAALRVW